MQTVDCIDVFIETSFLSLSLSLARLYVHTCDCLHCNDTARAVQTFISDYNVHEHQRALANANYTSYENSRKRRRNKPALANLPVIIYKFQWAPPIFFSLSLSACLNTSPLFVRMTHVVSIVRTSIARYEVLRPGEFQTRVRKAHAWEAANDDTENSDDIIKSLVFGLVLDRDISFVRK